MVLLAFGDNEEGLLGLNDDDAGDNYSLTEKISIFLNDHQWIIFLFFFFSLGLFLWALFSPAQAEANPAAGATFDFNYGPVLVYKSVFDESGRHVEKIVVSSEGGAKMLSLFVLVPKALAQSSADVILQSNGKISTMRTDPVYKIDAVNSDSISVEFSVNASEKEPCSLLIMAHSDALGELTPEQLQQLVDIIVAYDTPALGCESANEIEKELNARIYNAATTLQ